MGTPGGRCPEGAEGGIELSLRYNKNLIRNAKELRKNQTPQERKLWYEFLSKYPVRFQRQKVIDNYIADFYCAKAKLVIEVDENSHYENAQIEYDKTRDIILSGYDLKTIRFTNLEIAQNFEGVCITIDEIVKSRTSLPQSPEDDSSLV